VIHFGGCDTPEIFARVKQFDGLIVNGWVTRACIQAMLACRRHGVPCIVRGESNALRKRSLLARLGHRFLLRQYSAAIAIGRANRDFYRRNGMSAEKIFDGPYCVDNAWFARNAEELEPSRDEIRSRWGVPSGARVLLFCGKLEAKKRPLDLLQAVAALATRPGRPLPHVLFAGDGPLRGECEAFARARGLSTTFTGFLNQSRVSQAYVASDCLVLPSDAGETWGLVVNEAMASGRVALVSDLVGCHPDLVVPGVTGDVFPCGDVQALAQLLDAWCGGATKLAAGGEAARAHVAQYSVGRVVDGSVQALRFVTRGLDRG
jgi:glycosyltransferase involved in cell wall biosynthesis